MKSAKNKSHEKCAATGARCNVFCINYKTRQSCSEFYYDGGIDKEIAEDFVLYRKKNKQFKRERDKKKRILIDDKES